MVIFAIFLATCDAVLGSFLYPHYLFIIRKCHFSIKHYVTGFVELFPAFLYHVSQLVVLYCVGCIYFQFYC